MNRTLTDRLSDYHFAPTLTSEDNLKKEGVEARNILKTANTVIDALNRSIEVVNDVSFKDHETVRPKDVEPGSILKSPIKAFNHITVLTSRSYLNETTMKYMQSLRTKNKSIEITKAVSSLKFCLMAEGKADIYPRFGPSMEWDTAAG